MNKLFRILVTCAILSVATGWILLVTDSIYKSDYPLAVVLIVYPLIIAIVTAFIWLVWIIP